MLPVQEIVISPDEGVIGTGLQILKSCGFVVKIGAESQDLLVADTKKELMTLLKRASEAITTDDVTLKLGPDEYLGHYTDFLLLPG